MVNDYGAYGAITTGFQDLKSGAMGTSAIKMPNIPKSRKRMHPVVICLCFFLPTLVYIAVSWAFSFSLHHKTPFLSYIILLLSFMLACTFGALSYMAAMKAKQNPNDHYSGTWYIYLCAIISVAVFVGWWLGDLNYYTNMQQYYELNSLAAYYDVDPLKAKGAQMIDAGRVSFKSGSRLSLDKAYRFTNDFKYCVAPISVFDKDSGKEVERPSSYEFWSIGLNCCEPNRTADIDYRCGEYKNPNATQGLRLMRDDQREYFRLAVQQAEATYGIRALHPVFFYWTNDADLDMEGLQEQGYAYFKLGIMLFFIGAILSAMVAIFFFTKMGY